MQLMRMSYDDLTKGGGEAKLHVYGVGTFPVFSGQSHIPMIQIVPTSLTVPFRSGATG